MEQLRGGTQDRIRDGDPAMLQAIVEAGRELQSEGVRAVASRVPTT